MDKASVSDNTVTATCHCSAISVTAPRKPRLINECQCSICRRYAAAWAYYEAAEVNIQKKEGSETRQYIWNDRMIAFNFCETCGCIVYWWPVEKLEFSQKMGINTRLMEPSVLRMVDRRISYKNAPNDC